MPEADQHDDDPFFKRNFDSNWNACIGSQGDEENYLDGYIEAAIELVTAIIEKKMFEKRDTLVLPILYNTRHSVELALKFVTDRLVTAGLMSGPARRNHNIKAYWDSLHAANLGDEKLSKTVQALKPFVDSLSRIDDDGQELRYHMNRSDSPSLSSYPLANIEVIRASLSELSEIISVLKHRTMSFLDEHATGTFTSRCSRRDLLTIAQLVPRRELWRSTIFEQQKALIRSRFSLSNKEFSKALDAIQSNREMKALLGVETDLLYISDDEVVWVSEQWRRLHPRRDEISRNGSNSFDGISVEAMKAYLATEAEVIAATESRIKTDKLADLEALYYLARDRIVPEYYERRVEQAKKEHAAENSPIAEVAHLMEKTNLLSCLQTSATKLGRLALAERLAKL